MCYKNIEGELLLIPEQFSRFTFCQIVLRNIGEMTSVSLGLFSTIKPCFFTDHFQNKSKQSKKKGFEADLI